MIRTKIKDLVSNLSTIINSSVEKIDLSSIQWVTPFSILPLAHQVMKIHNQNPQRVLIYPEKEEIKSYLRTVVFPEGTNDPTKIKYGKTYLPIIRIILKQVVPEALEASISKYEKLLFDTLTDQIYCNNIAMALRYFISEMVDNVQQHSDASELWIMSQFWNKSGELELCLLDDGIGIQGAYKKANISVKNDIDALDKAIKGISVKKIDGGRGFGIRTSVNLLTRSNLKGEFVMISGEAGYYASHDHEPIFFTFSGYRWQGVIIATLIRKPMDQIDIYKYIE